MASFWNWLVGESGAGWIIGLVGLLSGLYAWLQRERPPRVVIQINDKTSFLNIHPSVQGRLRIFHVGEQGENIPIQSLEQTEIVIYNTGTKDITDPLEINIRFHFGKAQSFWQLSGDHTEGIVPMECTTHDTYIDTCFTLPYLNSYSIHQQRYTIFLLSEQPAKIELIPSSGKGWSSYLVPLDSVPLELKRTQNLVKYTIFGGMITTTLIGLIIMFLNITSNSNQNMFIIILSFAPFYIFTLLVTVFIRKFVRITHRKYPSKQNKDIP